MNRPIGCEQQGRLSLGVSAPSLPRVCMPTQMKHGEHGNEVISRGEELAVREIANECPSSAVLDLRELKRILPAAGLQRADNAIPHLLAADETSTSRRPSPSRPSSGGWMVYARDIGGPTAGRQRLVHDRPSRPLLSAAFLVQ